MNLHANARASYVSHLIGAHVISFIQVNDLVEWYLQRTHTPNLQTKPHTQHTWTVFAIKSIPLISPSILTGIVGDEMAFHQPSNDRIVQTAMVSCGKHTILRTNLARSTSGPHTFLDEIQNTKTMNFNEFIILIFSLLFHQIFIKSSQIARKIKKLNTNKMDLLWNSMPNTSFTPTFKWFANIGCLSSFLWSKHELSVYLFIHLPLNAWNSEFFAVLFDNLSHILFRNSAKRRNRHLFGLCARERSVGLSFENLVNWLSCDHHLCRSLSVQVRRIGPSHTFRYFSFVCLFIQHQRPRRFVYLKCLNLIMHRSHDAAHCSRSSHWPLCRWQLMAAR